MVGIVCVTTALIFDECKSTSSVNELELTPRRTRRYLQTTSSSSRSGNVATNKATISVGTASATNWLADEECDERRYCAQGKKHGREFDSPYRPREMTCKDRIRIVDRSIERGKGGSAER